MEADFAQRLDLLKRARGPARIADWERQVRFPLVVNGEHICFYIVDFHVLYANGHNEYIEVKGMWTQEARLKVKLFRALYPEITLTIHE
jgi:Protein of unknown function (DUF1064)